MNISPRAPPPQADRQQQPCYTEATNVKTLALLQRLGFEVFEDSTLFGVPYWLLRRLPCPV